MAADRSLAEDVRRARRRFVIVAVVVPLVITVVGIALMLIWLPQLPNPIAVHWSAAGHADGFGSPSLVVVLTAVIGVGLTALFAMPVLVASREGEWGLTMRLLGALSAGITVYLVTLATWSVAMQRGLADAHDAPSIIPALAAATVVGVVVGSAAWFVQPNVVSSGGQTPTTTEPGPFVLRPGEQVVWMRTSTMPAAGMIAVVGSTIAASVAATWMALSGNGPWVAIAFLALVLAVAACTTSVFRVRVSDDGLIVRSALGIPRYRVPLGAVRSVTVIHIDPMAQFGGWGIRLSLDGRLGVVLRRGDAIQVERTGARTFVVTVDDAATGAALLQALVERAHATGLAGKG
jgi:hypothetical protein